MERSEEARRIHFEVEVPRAATAKEPRAVTAEESRAAIAATSGPSNGERGGETKSETIPFSESDISPEEILRVQTAFVNLDSSRLPRISGFHSSKLLVRSLSDSIELILKRGQNVSMTMDSPVWIDGWLRPFKEVVLDSLPAQPSPPTLPDIVEHALETLQRSLSDEVAGPTAFQKLLTNISNDLQASDPPVNLSEDLRTFSVPAGTSFSAYGLLLFKVLDSVENASNTPQSVNLATVMDHARKSIFAQFPTKIQELFPGERRSCELPYNSINELRKRFESHMPDSVQSLERVFTKKGTRYIYSN